MISCNICDGEGTVYLQYLEEYPQDCTEEERWVPCGKCDGEGEVPDRRILKGFGGFLGYLLIEIPFYWLLS